MWHCPHCGAPQAETARCWVCRRSSTTCSTCRHFRTSLATDLGYCGLDPKRRPLTGLELRGCWQEGARAAPAMVAADREDGGRMVRPLPVLDPRAWQPPTPPRTFVPVGDVTPRRATGPAGGAGPAAEAARVGGSGDAGTGGTRSGAVTSGHAEAARRDPEAVQNAPDPALPFVDSVEAWEHRTSLFGEADR